MCKLLFSSLIIAFIGCSKEVSKAHPHREIVLPEYHTSGFNVSVLTSVQINIYKSGKYELNGKIYSNAETLKESLKSQLDSRQGSVSPIETLIIRADKNVEYKNVLWVILYAQQLKLNQVALVTIATDPDQKSETDHLFYLNKYK